MTPEAEVAAGAFGASSGRIDELVAGRELTGLGFADDAALAADVGGSGVAPVLRDGIIAV